MVSRGLSAKDIIENRLWWNGPPWLAKKQEQWPEPLDVRAINLTEEARAELKIYKVLSIQLNSTELEIFVHRFGKVPLLEYSRQYGKLIRILAYVLRFIRNIKKGKRQVKTIEIVRREKSYKVLEIVNWRSKIEILSEEEKCEALRNFLRLEQKLRYPKEYQIL